MCILVLHSVSSAALLNSVIFQSVKIESVKIKCVKQSVGNVVTLFLKSNLLWPLLYSSAEGFELMKQFMPSLFLPAISNH